MRNFRFCTEISSEKLLTSRFR